MVITTETTWYDYHCVVQVKFNDYSLLRIVFQRREASNRQRRHAINVTCQLPNPSGGTYMYQEASFHGSPEYVVSWLGKIGVDNTAIFNELVEAGWLAPIRAEEQ